ncbi:hypothetical protein RJ639_020244 [Escallonia herrerae]|uniref:Uncharacterized protein n=1 Tax=Escallonia herrerae TaxID=1293975 RepID=A0AA89AH21_9ASTE|nr:hypothetical protein RJ639_020244 [Escallonia herrerae]
MDPSWGGIEPEIRFMDRSKSASRFILVNEDGTDPVSWFRLSKALLIILSLPISVGISPESWLLLRSRCMRLPRLTMDGGIEPESWLSARLSTVSRLSWPMPAGIGPVSLLPIRSRMRRWGREVIQAGISLEMPFQSATTRVWSRSRLQREGEIDPVMKPDRPAFSNIGSSDSPRRVMSATRPLVGSQLTPYQFRQHSEPVQVLRMPNPSNGYKAAVDNPPPQSKPLQPPNEQHVTDTRKQPVKHILNFHEEPGTSKTHERIQVEDGQSDDERCNSRSRRQEESSYETYYTKRDSYYNPGEHRAERYTNAPVIVGRPFTEEVDYFPTPQNFKMPPCESYDGTGDPMEHLARFTFGMNLHLIPDQIMCRAFLVTLKGAAHDHNHTTNECKVLQREIENLIAKGHLKQFIKTNDGQQSGKKGNQWRTEEVPIKDPPVINTISGGPSAGGLTSSSQNAYARQVNLLPKDRPSERKRPPLALEFDDADLRRSEPST